MAKWISDNIPRLKGRSAIITGTGGLGFESALALSRAGADVIIAGRNSAKGAEAVSGIKQAAPGASVRFEVLDLASLRSIEEFRSRVCNHWDSLDILVNFKHQELLR